MPKNGTVLGTANLQKAVEYGAAEHQEVKLNAKKNAAKAKNATAVFTDAPDLNNAEAAEWIVGLKAKAKAAKGRFKDSAQYKKFYDNVKVTTELATKLLAANTRNLKSLPLTGFDANTKKLLSGKAVNGQVSLDALKEAYQSSWINVQNSATTYEKYKFEEKGFTKNPQTKPGT